jgi:hypothetical protein
MLYIVIVQYILILVTPFLCRVKAGFIHFVNVFRMLYTNLGAKPLQIHKKYAFIILCFAYSYAISVVEFYVLDSLEQC